MTQYSGRTTAHAHKSDDWREKDISNIASAIQQETVFYAQWTDCPVEVEEEVKKLWRIQELRNDNCYFSWDRNEEHSFSVWKADGTHHKAGDIVAEGDWPDEDKADDFDKPLSEWFPLIDEYLMSKGVEKCLIHWWW